MERIQWCGIILIILIKILCAQPLANSNFPLKGANGTENLSSRLVSQIVFNSTLNHLAVDRTTGMVSVSHFIYFSFKASTLRKKCSKFSLFRPFTPTPINPIHPSGCPFTINSHQTESDRSGSWGIGGEAVASFLGIHNKSLESS